jgi:hypothetical protein
MRRHALEGAVFLLLVACSTFSATAPEPGSEDGGAGEGGTIGDGGTTDAAGDTPAPTLDSGALTDAGSDGGGSACTPFDRMPSPDTGWVAAVAATGGSLTFVTQAGRAAVDAHVEANNQRAALVHDVSPGSAGSITIETDFIAATSAGSGGSLVELLVLECSTPPLKIALEVEPGGALLFESMPASGETLLGVPTAAWRALKLVVAGSSFHVELDGVAEPPHTMMNASFAGALGCTVAIGAKATANIGATTGYYSSACIR